jgi:catechol 2,3-dioxygenase-like lactoylglutathione lyase family enzyme
LLQQNGKHYSANTDSAQRFLSKIEHMGLFNIHFACDDSFSECNYVQTTKPSKTMNGSIANPTTVNVRYIVNNVDTCVTFYTQLLGFEVIMHTPDAFAMLSKGNLHLVFNKPGAGGAGQTMPDGVKPAPGGWNRFQLEVQNIETMIEDLKRKKAKFRNELVIAPAGKQILLMDPSGNLIELFERKQ